MLFTLTNSSPEPVLGLGEDQGLRTIKDLIINLLRMPRKAVHELPAGLGAAALGQLVGDLEAGESLEAPLGLGLLAHGHPGVGDQDVGVLDGLLGDRGLDQLAGLGHALGGSQDDLLHTVRNAVAGGRGDGDVDAQHDAGSRHVEEHVVGVADPGDLHTLESQAGLVGGLGGEGLVDGLEVGNGLERVEVIGQGVDDGHRRVLGQVGHVRVRTDAGYHARGHGGDDHGSVVEGLVDLWGVVSE